MLASSKPRDSKPWNRLTHQQQQIVILQKLVGRSNKDAALSAGYSLSVAENTMQRIWKPRVSTTRWRTILSGWTPTTNHAQNWLAINSGC
jgi:hypothetical protein